MTVGAPVDAGIADRPSDGLPDCMPEGIAARSSEGRPTAVDPPGRTGRRGRAEAGGGGGGRTGRGWAEAAGAGAGGAAGQAASGPAGGRRGGEAWAGPQGTLAERLGVELRNPSLLRAALTHRSYAYEQGLEETNERLELLGDAVLNLVITDILYKTFPTYLEGDLAKLRASLVSAPALAEVASELDLGREILLGRGEELTGGRRKPSILADCLEAVLGAVFLDRGMRAARRVIRNLFGARIAAAVGKEVPRDAKTRLQELVTRRHGTLPRYRVVGEGPDHAKRFEAEVYVEGELCGRGEGRSKKEAEQAAAAQALVWLAAREAPEGG